VQGRLSVRVTRTEPLGARIDGMDLADACDPATIDALRDLLADHGVLVFPDQDQLDDDGFETFLRYFGPLAFTAGETPLAGHPDLNAVTNVGRTTAPTSAFHVDTAYVSHPPAFTALRAVVVPATGGETLFTDQCRAAATLPTDLYATVHDRTITHVVTGVNIGPDDQSAAEHPILRPHPRSGRPVLYLDSPGRCGAVSGLNAVEAGALVTALLQHSTAPAGVLRHRWAAGDVVVWDNARVMHRADHSGVIDDRVLHRGMVAAAGHVSA
jgi:taurine dioxygenase